MNLVDVPEKRLPSDFADRLVRSIRRRKRMRAAKLISAAAASALVCVGLFGLFPAKPAAKPSRTALVAAHPAPTNDTQVSGLMMLGLFRECFRRTRTNRKKEEDYRCGKEID